MMLLLPSLAAVIAVATQTAALPSSCGATSPSPKAIYIISNEQTNAVIALPVAANGMVSAGTSTATGGAGSNSIDGSTKEPAAPDALVSQSALTIAGHMLFAVNAGSNTVSMFAIDETDPTKLTLIGQPAAVPGEFPNTVAASSKHKITCVGSTGAKAGISCASFSPKCLGAMDGLRPFDLRQSTPPVGPTNTVSQVFFSEDQKTLFATVKGDPAKNNTGFLASFNVGMAGGKASVVPQGTISSPQGTAILFGSSVIPGSENIFVTDASFGGAVLSVKKGSATVLGKAAVQGQKATCWVAISPATKSAFVTDVATNRLVEMSTADASIKGIIDLGTNGDPGLIDLKASGNFIYALSPGNGTMGAAVTVVDAAGKRQVQHFELKALGVGKNGQGMAVLQY